MNDTGLSRRDRRVLLFGALVCFPMLVLGASRPILAWGEHTSTVLERERDLLSQELALLEESKDFDRRTADVEAWAIEQNRLRFPGDSASALAAFSRHMDSLAAHHALELRPGVKESARGNAGRELHLHIEAAGSAEDVMEWLDEVESGQKVVIFEEVSIEHSVREPDFAGQTPGTLTVAADLVAFALEDGGLRE